MVLGTEKDWQGQAKREFRKFLRNSAIGRIRGDVCQTQSGEGELKCQTSYTESV